MAAHKPSRSREGRHAAALGADWPRRLVVVCATAALLGGCAFGPGGKGNTKPGATDSAKPADSLQLKVPSAFDANGGWQFGVANRSYAIAARAGVFVDVSTRSSPRASAPPSASASPSPSAATGTASPPPKKSASPTKGKDGGVVDDLLTARGFADGKVKWSSKPLLPLAEQRDTMVRVVNTAQGEYVVVVRTGVIPASGVLRSRPVTVVDSFPAGLRGPDQASAQHFERDLVSDSDKTKAVIGDGGVLFPGVADGSEKRVGDGLLWNPVTGAATPASAGDFRQGGCDEEDNCPVQDVPRVPTSAGLLTREMPFSPRPRFGIVGGWSSDAIRPQGQSWGEPIRAVGTMLVVAWRAEGSTTVLYAAHNLGTGALVASVTCAPPEGEDGSPSREMTDDHRAAMSPQGRYLVADSVSFDLSAGTAKCLDGDELVRGVSFVSVGDDGVAYGILLEDEDEDDDDDPVAVRLSTGKVDPLPAGTLVPRAVATSGVGMFLAHEKRSKEKPVVAMLPAVGATGASPSKKD
ncbi:hypothetical protein [Yinghuangia sp. YIM S09857]|uniref:hypothetical protein n=1 Tax=Yinghuangia sp. YIM S09857 TaxID=3436929 RepID=UPI003F538CF9